MLFRSLRVPPSFLLALAILAFLAWQVSQGSKHEGAVSSPLQSNVVEPRKGPRIALITFVTDQRSYLHIVLRNKDRKRSFGSFRYTNVAKLTFPQTMLDVTAMI